MRNISSVRSVVLGCSAALLAACGGTENDGPFIALQANAADTVDIVAEQNGEPVSLSVLFTSETGPIPATLTATPSFSLGATPGWLSGSVTVTDSTSALLEITADPGSLPPGTYVGQLTVGSSDDGAGAPGLPIRLSIGVPAINFDGLYVGSYDRVTTGGCTSEKITRPVTFDIEQLTDSDSLTIRLALQDPDFIALSGLRADAKAASTSFFGEIPGPFPVTGSVSGKVVGTELIGTVQIIAPGFGCNGTTKYHAITYRAQRPNDQSSN